MMLGPWPRSLVRVALALAILAPAFHAAPATAAIQTRHVIIVTIDGGRWTETLGQPSLANHPRMGHDLAPLGSQPARFENIGVTTTMPGHAAILTGTLQPILNDGSERPHAPTLFECLRKSKSTPDSLVRIVAEKGKLAALAWSDSPGYGAAYGATVHLGNSDLETFAIGQAELLRYKPTLMLLHFGEPDVWAHALDWAKYNAALHTCDSLVWRLWNDIQGDPELAGRTTLFVTNDHGRHDDAHGGFQNHGDGCDGCRHIMMLMVGPDCFQGVTTAGHHDQRAIACTAAYLLGVPMPFADGVVMNDLLLEPSGPFLGIPGVPTSGVASGIAIAPNPTRDGATVRLAAGADAGARVEVLDATGRRMARLAPDGSAGLWRWDGRDARGRRAPPGSYLVRVTYNAHTEVARLVKLRP